MSEPKRIIKPEGETLLSKYRIPLDHFEFDYIEKCSDAKEMERIVQILRSGEEGHYPALTKAAEDKLEQIQPKSKLLRMPTSVINSEDLVEDERNTLRMDLTSWLKNVNKNNNELESRKTNVIENSVDIRENKSVQEKDETQTNKNEKRIKSTDYESWNQYDPDTEILKLELNEEKLKKKAIEEELKKVKIPKKSVVFNQYATEAEAIFYSEREREKGNEFFKAGDFEEALHSYNASIAAKKTCNNLNNRAAANLMLKNYEKVLEDCNLVLTLDSKNEKALTRKAQALQSLKRYGEALNVVNIVINANPNDSFIQEMANKLRSYCKIKNRKPRRMVITEVSDDEDDD